jgi:hypothetical protein
MHKTSSHTLQRTQSTFVRNVLFIQFSERGDVDLYESYEKINMLCVQKHSFLTLILLMWRIW